MAKFKKREHVTEAVQWRRGDNHPGLHYGPLDTERRYPYLINARGARTHLRDGDWIVEERDRGYYFAVCPTVFETTYAPVQDHRAALPPIATTVDELGQTHVLINGRATTAVVAYAVLPSGMPRDATMYPASPLAPKPEDARLVLVCRYVNDQYPMGFVPWSELDEIAALEAEQRRAA